METEFIPINEKANLLAQIRQGDEKAITTLINDIGRLEGVIKDYELGIRQVIQKYDSHISKKPQSNG